MIPRQDIRLAQLMALLDTTLDGGINEDTVEAR
jgi:hypothetical protein